MSDLELKHSDAIKNGDTRITELNEASKTANEHIYKQLQGLAEDRDIKLSAADE